MKTSHNPFSHGFYSIAAPSTEAQREIWATMQMVPEATLSYNEVIEVSLKGNLKLEALKDSLRICVERHDILRSVYSEDGKTFLIQDSANIDFSVVDLSLNEGRVIHFQDIKDQQVLIPFQLKNGPCIRFVLVKKNIDENALLVAAHHIVCDGWSFAVILTEISQIYSSLVENTELTQVSPSQFTEYAMEEFKNGLDDGHKKYWLEQFKTPLSVNTFPTDHRRPAFRTYESKFFRKDIPEELVLKLKRLGMNQKSSFYNVLMANFMILIKRISGSQDIVVGVASAAQSGTGKHDLVGHLVNLLPLRTSVDEAVSFADFLRSLRTKMLDAFDHQYFSYGTLLKELNITRNPSEIPLLNCVFNIDQQTPGQGLSFVDLNASYEVVPRAFENFELFVNAVSCENKLSIECQYNSALFEHSTIENWFACYLELLNICVESVNAPIRNMSIEKLKVPNKHIMADVVKSNNATRNSEIEARLIRLWEKVLGVKSISVEDNFFVLGGHSLLAVELASLIQNEFKKEITIREIFENPTILEFSAKLSELSQIQDRKVLLESRPDVMVGPVSHNQMQIWYIEELFTDTKMHNLSTSLRIKWDLDPAILEKTVHYFLGRHESLRTAILVEDGVPYQKIFDKDDPVFRPALEVVRTDEKNVFDLMQAETAKPFDKTSPPMFRACLYQLGKSDFFFFFNIHHAVWDGWCFDIFFEELDVIYTALEKGLTPVFKRNPEVRYLDHCIWVQDSLDNGDMGPQVNYWKNKLKAPLPVLQIPGDYLRPKSISHNGGHFGFSLGQEQIRNLKNYSASKNTTVFNVMLTIFKITIAHFSGIQDIIVGSPIRNRNKPELLQTIGYFVNTLALRSQIDLKQSFEENLKRVTTTCLEAFSNQDLPFELLLRNVDFTRDLGHTAIFQTFFTFQDMTNRQFYIDDRPVHQVGVSNASVKTDLDMWVRVTTSSIEGAFEFRLDLFDKSTIAELYACFEMVLNHLSMTDVDHSIPLLPLNRATRVLNYKNAPIIKSQIPFENHALELPSILLSLVPVRKSGSALPVFFFHGVGGNILNYIPLMKHIDETRPVFALQSQGIDGKNVLKESIEDMARGYIREMKLVNPEGPYLLVGGSMGGMIAFEVAQQLKNNNDKIEKLIVLDTFGPDVNIQVYDKSDRSFLKNFQLSIFYRRKMFINQIRKIFHRTLGLSLPLDIRLFDTEMANYRALWKYKPKTYEGDLQLIRAPRRATGWYSDPLMGWGKTIKGTVHSIEIEGTHNDFIESPKLGEVLGRLV